MKHLFQAIFDTVPQIEKQILSGSHYGPRMRLHAHSIDFFSEPPPYDIGHDTRIILVVIHWKLAVTFYNTFFIY